MAYALGQILDVNVFNRLRQNRRWYVAPAAAMFVGNLIDTGLLLYRLLAQYRSVYGGKLGGNRHGGLQFQSHYLHAVLPAGLRRTA